MSQRTIVITGASDGIGAASARMLAGRDENVILVGRSGDKTAACARSLNSPYLCADFTRLEEVRSLAARLRDTCPRVDVLANNAGGIMGKREMTVDGFEKTMQVNHLAHFLLTHLLMDVLIASGAKVINTSSIAARRFGHLDLDDLDNHKAYSPSKAYGDGKLANILFTKELHRRHHGQGVNTVAFHPGNVATSFASESTSWLRYVYHTPVKHLALISPERGAKRLLWLVDGAPGVDWASGAYYEKNKRARSHAQAGDQDFAREFWERSAQMLGLITD